MAQTYITQAGDTLSSIAEQFYGERDKWSIVSDANQGLIADPDHIEAGLTLTIPQPEQPATGMPSYVTAEGDSLRDVAKRVYGDAEQWQVLFDANRSILGDDPDSIPADTTLQIPPLATTGERTYTTVQGDTLQSIAERFYGDAIKRTVVYDVNREVIGDDPDTLAPGLNLKIP